MRTTHRALLLAALGCLLFTTSCSKKSSQGTQVPASAITLPADLTTKPGNSFEGTFTDAVVKEDPKDFIAGIRSISDDHTTFVFDENDPLASKLKEGSVFFVPGMVMRLVDIATKTDGYFVVVTEDAALNEAFKDAKIKMDYPVDFTQVPQEQVRVAPPGPFEQMLATIQPTVYAANKLTYSGKKDEFKYTVSAEAVPGRLNVNMVVTAEYNGLEMKIDGDGFIQNFEVVSDFEIQNGDVTMVKYKNKDFKGAMDFSWEAAKKSPGVEAQEKKMKFPSTFKIPMPIGGIPFSLEVSEALLIHPAFTGGSESTQGKFHVEYTGSQGFTVDQSNNINQDDQADGDVQIVKNFGLAPVAPVGFVAAVAMPRVELKLGSDSLIDTVQQYVPSSIANKILGVINNSALGKKIKKAADDKLKTNAAAYAQVVISTSSIAAGQGSLVPCQHAQLITTITVGANATVLGKSKAKVSKDIFKKTREITVPPIKACELGES
jgi:hypothetical protein